MDFPRFTSVVSIWIHKPHVIHPKIFAAQLPSKPTTHITNRTIVPIKRLHTEPFHERIVWTKAGCTFSSEHGTYSILLVDDQILIHVDQVDENFFRADWFLTIFQEKLNTWIKQEPHSLTMSLAHVDVIFYQDTYERLKERHAKGILQKWCEKTDPLKFTYEDLGIAAYLICLWKDLSDVFFMDIGCGNGLLVYLLVTEGFKGVGVDLRRRRLWDTYPDPVRHCLQESTLDPEHATGFPQVTWLIGNHSDELTPWLPVLAARSGPQCNVFALPCCPFGLFGKYNNFMHPCEQLDCDGDSDPADAVRDQPPSTPLSHSRHGTYTQYLRGLFQACGFVPEVDILRIPSTKRICILGRKQLPTSDQTVRIAAVNEAIARERQLSANLGVAGSFVPRGLKEPVRNCTQISADTKKTVSELVFRTLLSRAPDRSWLESRNLVVSDSLSIKTLDGRWWNPGGQLTLHEVSELLTPNQLEVMKSQHGGLQTLLRNHHQAFEIRKGLVALRWIPERMALQSGCSEKSSVARDTTRKRPMNRKSKPCWMFEHHPDRCPYSAQLCDFAHGPAELCPLTPQPPLKTESGD